MLIVNSQISIPEDELKFQFVLASGPGGQNVNKVATAAQLRFNVAESLALTEDVRERLQGMARNQISKEGVLIITSKRYRTQERNRQDAIQKLIALIQKAATKPKLRKKRKVSLAAKRIRVEDKRKNAKLKQLRKKVSSSE